MTIDLDLSVEAGDWAMVPDVEDLVRHSVEAAARAGGLPAGVEAEVSVLLCDDATIQTLNRTWRGQDKPTNVLSFPAPDASPPGAPRLLGDIAIAWDTTRREAEQEGKTVADHLCHLAVHGTLHLLGSDHETEADAVAMEDLERRVLEGLGIADPYLGSEPIEVVAR